MIKFKMTMDELLKTIKQKKVSAQLDRDSLYKSDLVYKNVPKIDELKGEINAYTDLIALIESKRL